MKKTALFTSLLCLAQSTLHADVPLFINYQGKVTDSTGLPIGASGTAAAPVAAPVNRKVIFRIYDAATGGNRLWSEEQTATISLGVFSVLLGNGINPTGTAATETRPALDTVFTPSAATSRFLEIMVDNGDNTITASDVPISPRQQITSTAFALHAKVADGIASATDLTINPLTGTATNYGLGWYGTGRLFNSVAIDGPVLYGNSGGALGSNAGGTQKLALAWNAAGQVGVGATSSYDTNNKLTLQGDDSVTPARQLVIRGNADSAKRLNIGYDTTANQATLQSYTAASTFGNLLLNPSGGNVGIGNTNPAVALSVTGAITATGAITGGSITTNTGNIGIGTTAPAVRLDIIDGTTAGSYGSVQISRPNATHMGSHLAFVRAGVTAMGVGYAPASNVFGFGQGTSLAFNPDALSINANNWYVGIGTASPGYKLDVRGNGRFTDTLTADAPIVMGPGSQIYGSAVAGVSKPVFWPRATDDATYLNIGSNGWYVRDDANNVVMRLTSAGRLGLGTWTPANHLQVQAPVSAQVATNAVAAGNAVAAIGASDVGLHFGTYNNTNGYGSWIQSMRTWDSYSFNLVLNPNGGNVGIGTSLPGYPLSVAPRVNVAYTSNTVTNLNGSFTPQLGNADGYTAQGSVGMTGQTWMTSIFAEGVVAGSAFVAMSDLRIKDIVNRSSTQSDLALINQLQVTDYRLKDSIGNGKSIRKGFIAQEVRKIIPEAVSPSPNFIPDIYVLATQSVYDAAQKRLSVTLAKPHALAIGESVRLYGDDNTMETKVLTVESATSFTVASEKPMAKAFVYGRRVDDFLTVDYDRLFTTGIGAIQELDRQLKEKDAKIAALEAKVADQDKRSTAQADEVTSQNARLVALEKMMSKAGAPETVSIKLGEQ